MAEKKEKPTETEEKKETVQDEQTLETDRQENTDGQEEKAAPLKEMEEKVAAMNEKYLRLSAEFDNYRKRTVKEKAELIVVGYPKNMNNTIGERAEKCQKFAELVSRLSGIPAELWDERSTTVTAHNYLNETNVRGKKRKAVVDAVAATIILETYLAYRKNRLK